MGVSFWHGTAELPPVWQRLGRPQISIDAAALLYPDLAGGRIAFEGFIGNARRSDAVRHRRLVQQDRAEPDSHENSKDCETASAPVPTPLEPPSVSQLLVLRRTPLNRSLWAPARLAAS